jgi:hypothetical protein
VDGVLFRRAASDLTSAAKPSPPPLPQEPPCTDEALVAPRSRCSALHQRPRADESRDAQPDRPRLMKQASLIAGLDPTGSAACRVGHLPRQCRCGVGWVDAPDRPRLPSATSGLPISGATTSKGFCSMATRGLKTWPPLSHGGGTGISVSNSAPCSAISWSTTPRCSESRCGAPGTRSAAETRSNRA